MTFSSAATAESHDYPRRLPGRPKAGSADGWYCRTESAVCYWNGHNFIYWPKNADEATRIFWRKARKLG